MKMLSWVLLVPVYFYKYAVSPLLPASCRHVPTCSVYAIEAIRVHGPFKGFWLTLRRVSRCHPWGTHGYDPVPPANKRPGSTVFMQALYYQPFDGNTCSPGEKNR